MKKPTCNNRKRLLISFTHCFLNFFRLLGDLHYILEPKMVSQMHIPALEPGSRLEQLLPLSAAAAAVFEIQEIGMEMFLWRIGGI